MVMTYEVEVSVKDLTSCSVTVDNWVVSLVTVDAAAVAAGGATVTTSFRCKAAPWWMKSNPRRMSESRNDLFGLERVDSPSLFALLTAALGLGVAVTVAVTQCTSV